MNEHLSFFFSLLFLLHVQNQKVMTVWLALLWLGQIHGCGVGKQGAEGRDVGVSERRSRRGCVARSSRSRLVCCTFLLRLGRVAAVAR